MRCEFALVDLHFPEAESLKSKRKDLQSIKAVLQRRFGAAVAETGYQDLWQRSRLTVALTSGSLAHLQEAVDRWAAGSTPAAHLEWVWSASLPRRKISAT